MFRRYGLSLIKKQTNLIFIFFNKTKKVLIMASTLIANSKVVGSDLEVTLTNGQSYTYAGAAGEKSKLDEASSKGNYFVTNIKPKYAHSKS